MQRSDESTICDLIAEAQHALKEGPHPERARLDAESLLLHVVRGYDQGRDKAWLMRNWAAVLLPQMQTRFSELVARRAVGEPIQYITGATEFFGLPFVVTPDVLIPRPETEHLVEEVVRIAPGLPPSLPLQIADIGTGSGAIAVALAHALLQARISAVDISPVALAIAKHNARRNQVADRIEFFEGDLLAPLAGRRFSVIASNPPYVPLADCDSLSVEVRDHEPHTALFAGGDGLDVYRRLIPAARELLIPGGWLVMEIGFGQRAAIEAMLLASGYDDVRFAADYQGIPRVALGRVTAIAG